MTLDSRSTKRRRVSSSPQTIVILPPGQSRTLDSDNGQQQFTRHADFWLDDGNLILIAGDTAFRVYQGLLKKVSSVFADMFATGSADATETFDGCPVVRLPDHPKDLSDFLQYLMPCSKLTLHDGLPVSDFAELHAAVHLAHKYQCPDVETRALSVLKKFYTPRFTNRSSGPYYTPEGFANRPSMSAAIAAVNIARLTDTPSMLPFALYEACTLEERILDGYERRDGSVEHLAHKDLRLCLRARGELAKQLALFIQDVFRTGPSAECESPPQCSAALNTVCDEVQVDVLGGCRIFDFATDEVSVLLCKECVTWIRLREEVERKTVWDMLPHTFGMTTKECGFTSGDELLQ
ncbi:hypothetical protein GSI_12301 [Ganoderma sinense ZZ0214-1]|uniref:BTB domain-containing protein n=1 Tax=Ganoderma sinense ZZ0214-1 TaxID=1077348 RepID=A0A2G8RYE5_9APHY|nr:hypothetical protein GSI_12301 [Ganoderma sinense ZZ0214-1]